MAPAVKVKPARVTESPAAIFAALNVTLAVSVELVDPPCWVVTINGADPETGAAKSATLALAVELVNNKVAPLDAAVDVQPLRVPVMIPLGVAPATPYAPLVEKYDATSLAVAPVEPAVNVNPAIVTV